MCFFRSRLHIMFSDAIDHWMFWQCPNVSFFRQIWRKNQQSPVIYSVSIWHDLPCMLFDVPCLHKKRKFTHQRCRGVASSMCATSRNVNASPPQPHPNLHMTHQQRTMCTHEHTSSVPCLHKKPKVHTPTLPRRSIQHVCNFQKRGCIPTPTPPQPAHDTPATYHVYTWTHQQRTMFT